MTTPLTWLITGASRGIGLEYVRQVVKKGDTIFAAVRSPDTATELQQLQQSNAPGLIRIIQLDVCNPQSIVSAAKLVETTLQDRGLDYLISNAGIANDGAETPSTIKPDEMIHVFRTNVVGSVLVYQSFLPLLERSKRPGGPVLVNMSSGVGSISRAAITPPAASYAISKAALNMLTAKQALEKPNIIVISMSPGWLKTDLGGSNAMYDVDFSVENQVKLVVGATPADSGKFKFFNGDDVPW